MGQETKNDSHPPKPDEASMFALIVEQRQSGLTVKSFCKQKQLPVHTYYYWNKKYQNKDKPAFTRLQLQNAPSCTLFCELITPSGGRLRFYQPVPVSFLQSLL